MHKLSHILFAIPVWATLLSMSAFAAGMQDDAVANTPVPETAGVQEARDLFVQALKQTGKERLTGLKKSFERLEVAATENEHLPPALSMWGSLLFSAGDMRLARQALQQATTVHPKSPDAYVLLANMAAAAGQLAEADLCFDQARHLVDAWSPTHPRRVPLLAQIAAGRATVAQARSASLASMNKPALAEDYEAAALDALREWVSLAPDNARANERLASALILGGDQEGAIAFFDRARKLDPSLPLTEFRLANAMLARGNREAALEQVNRATVNTTESNVQLTAANLMHTLGETVSAAKLINSVLNAEPENANAKFLKAQNERFVGNWQAATAILQELNTNNPADFEIANLLALSLSEIDSEEARKRALALASVTTQRFDQLDTVPGRRARITLVWTAFAAGQQQAAKSSFQELLRTGISSDQVSGDEAYYVSRLLVEFGRPELASTLLSNVLNRQEAFPKRKDCEQLLTQLQ